MIKIFKHIFKTKINFPTAQKFVGVLILFSIALQIFTPITTFATHGSDESVMNNLRNLSPNEYNQLHLRVQNKVVALGYPATPHTRIMLAKISVLPTDTIKSMITGADGIEKYIENNLKSAVERVANGEEDISSCSGFFSNLNIECLVTRGIAWVGYRILQIVSWLLFISAKIFDLSAQLSLDYRAYSAKTAKPVYLGWRAARDFVNILFIFIILIIALALILQVQQYYSRQVLVKLVGVALFINFSFFLCQQIINFTNSAAIYFKDRVTGCEEPDECWNNWELSKIFVEALNPQQMLNNYTVETRPALGGSATETEIQKLNATMQEKNPGMIAMIIATFGGIIIILAASFVLLAAAGMFLLRLVMLWNIIILAPIAITASILPVTQRHFSAWWTRFTREAFFAPAMMFMFYIEMSILKQGFLRDFVKGNAPSGTNVFGSMGTTFTFNFYLIAIYILMMMLFVKALFVARSMSATGANAIWNGGKRAIKRMTGDHGRKPYYAMGRQLRRQAAPYAEKIATGEMQKGEGRIGRAMGYKWNIPGRILKGGIEKGMKVASRKIVTDERKSVEERAKKRFGNLSSKELAGELNAKKLTSNKYLAETGVISRKDLEMVQLLQQKGDLGMVNTDILKSAHKYMTSIGMSTKDLETYMPSLAKDETGREKAVQRQQADKTSDYLQIADEFDYTKNPKNRDLQLKTWGDGHLKEMFKSVSAADPSDTKILPQAKNLLQGYVDKYGASMDNIVRGLEKDNNSSAARFLKTAEGERMFQTMAEKTGVAKPARGTYAAKAQAKEDLQLEDRELVNDVIRNKDGSLNQTKEGKERTFAVIQQADNKRLSDILTTLQTLSATEKKEFLLLAANKDKDTAQRIVNINPTIIRDADQATKNILGLETIQDVVDKMPSKNAQYMTHDALMDEEVIKALSKPQLMNLAENNIPTKEERNKIINTLKTPIITITGAPQTAVSDEIKNYIESSSYWGNKPWENKK